ncbi:cell division protein FtsL [sediment metagenome]|uniref:Cell division protein FtsL n=1 Tax=sediment metagenome TaxID=749907 RepID=D9PJW0_9ZZZZ
MDQPEGTQRETQGTGENLIMVSNLVVADTVRHQHIGEKSVAARNRKIKVYCFIIVSVLVLSLVYVWTRVCVVQQGYEVSRLNKESDKLAGEKSRLESEIAALKSPKRLEVIAKEHFGMREPHGDEIVLVEP